MGQFQLPPRRVTNSALAQRGRANVVMIDCLPVTEGERLELTFESTASLWRQGVWLRTDEFVMIDGQRCPGVVLWQDTAPERVRIECHTRTGSLHLYNIWDRGRGRESQLWTSGMVVEDLPQGRRYRCNDVGFETNFDKLVVRLERVAQNE